MRKLSRISLYVLSILLLSFSLRAGAASSCIDCHKESAKSFEDSVHGKGALGPLARVSVDCMDCHKDHGKEDFEVSNTPVVRGNDIKTCGDCHIKQREIYFKTFHGRYFSLRKQNTPTCVFCHPGHELPKDNPKSPINPANIGKVCAGCHGGSEDATKEVMAENLNTWHTGSTLYSRDVWGLGPVRISNLVDLFYYILFTIVVGFFSVYVVTDFIRRIRR